MNDAGLKMAFLQSSNNELTRSNAPELALKYANRATESRIRLISYRHVLHYQVPITVCKKAQMQGYFSGTFSAIG